MTERQKALEVVMEMLEFVETSGETLKLKSASYLSAFVFMAGQKTWAINPDGLFDLIVPWDNFWSWNIGDTRSVKLVEAINQKTELRRFLKLQAFE